MLKTMNPRPVGGGVAADSHNAAAAAVAASTEAGDAGVAAGMDPVHRDLQEPNETKKRCHFRQKPIKKEDASRLETAQKRKKNVE